jgi:hypothetical protein
LSSPFITPNLHRPIPTAACIGATLHPCRVRHRFLLICNRNPRCWESAHQC